MSPAKTKSHQATLAVLVSLAVGACGEDESDTAAGPGIAPTAVASATPTPDVMPTTSTAPAVGGMPAMAPTTQPEPMTEPEPTEPEPTEPEPTEGVNCTDDLETCYSEMADGGGGTVVLDSNTYLLQDTITIESNMTVTGQGPGATIIAWEDPKNQPMFNRTSGTADNTRWTDLTIDCGGNYDANTGWTAARGVYLTGGGSQSDAASLAHENFSMENVEILNCGGEGIQIKGTHKIRLTNIDFHDNGYGENNVSLWHNMYLKRAREIVVEGSRLTDSPVGHGMRMSDLEDVFLKDVIITGNGEHGIHADNCVDFVGENVTVNNNCNMPEGGCSESQCFGDCRNFNPL